MAPIPRRAIHIKSLTKTPAATSKIRPPNSIRPRKNSITKGMSMATITSICHFLSVFV
jgi:hypothetical protein